ncbi:ascorbate-dependent monooxygenase [Tundrisphaera lichenicola]|uniref:ascorbate-dependent monooxygenase n=1 Tax=Tundrisphaera lichenicola TaxID=2029860 RepID=UPI003EB8170F
MPTRTWPLIALALLVDVGVAGADAPTFNKDVAPILWKNCAGCHRPGEVGPFSLLSFKDAAKRANFLREITETRRMPPWKAEPGFGEFHDERKLTEAEIRTIADWTEAGAPEGDPKDLPEPPRFSDGWQLGEPNLVVKASEPFEVPASGDDIYRCFVIPIPTETDRTVAAFEFRPGNRKVVHHAILFLDNTGAARRKDEAQPGPGYASFGGPGILPTGALGGWAPGAMPRFLPEGMGKYLRKGSDLVLQVHYHPDGKAELDQSVVGIYFTKTPARKIVGGIAVRTRNLNIPAGEKRHHVTAQSAPLPVDAQAIGITPHMHNVGREMKVVAESPDGTTIPLIWIKDWDFNWQGQYQYRSPVKLTKGTVIKLDAYYDNSSENPRNPNTPPKRVTWGEQTTDEMCLVGVQVVTEKPGDLLKIVAMRGNGLGSALVGGLGRGQAGKGGVGSPAGGFAIPERFQDRLGRFDTNGDGRISSEEVDAMPEPFRDRLKEAIRVRLGGDEAQEQP